MLPGVTHIDGRGDFYGSTTTNAIHSPQSEKLNPSTIISIDIGTIARNLPGFGKSYLRHCTVGRLAFAPPHVTP